MDAEDSEDYYKDIVRMIIEDGFAKYKLAGFGNAVSSKEGHKHKISGRSHRAPEVILGQHFDSKADIWSAGCSIFKTVTGADLFFPRPTTKYSTDENHISQIVRIFGEFPPSMILRSHKSKVA